jgi:hypothetical protein
MEEYHPRSAEGLAAARVTREKKAAEKEERAFREGNPLLAWSEAVKATEEADQERGR